MDIALDPYTRHLWINKPVFHVLTAEIDPPMGGTSNACPDLPIHTWCISLRHSLSLVKAGH